MGKFFIAALVCGQVFAQQAEDKNLFGAHLLVGSQKNGSFSNHVMDTYDGTAYKFGVEVNAKNCTATSARFDYMRKVGTNWAFGLSYTSQGETDVDADIITTEWSQSSTQKDQLKYSAKGFGAMFFYDGKVTAGAGVDYKREEVSVNGLSDSAFNRSWMRLSVGKRFQWAGFQPYVGLEYAKPLSKKKLSDAKTPEEVIQTLAPTSQINVALGVYF